MKLGVMQPYFFPYIGYFDLIAKTDRWIVFDVVQYNRKTWMNRNRILHPSRGWQYVNLPVKKAPRGTPMYDIEVSNQDDALNRLLGQIEHYKRHAPYFRYVKEIIEKTFECTSGHLVDINVESLKVVCDYLEIEFNASRCSGMGMDLDEVKHAGQWALEIAKQTGASEYINQAGGKSIFDQAEWDAESIRLSFNERLHFRYDCPPYMFEEDLSIIDVLMWNDADTVREAIGPGLKIREALIKV